MGILTRVKVSSSSLVALKSHVATYRLKLLSEKTAQKTRQSDADDCADVR